MKGTSMISAGDLTQFPDLTDNNRDVFSWSMAMLDGHASRPLFWRNAKSSAWYCTALLARGQPRDVDMALEYIRNILQQQYTQEGDVTYGTYKGNYTSLWANGKSLAKPQIYKTYDPNNALFVTIAFVMIDANFSHLVPIALLTRMREAMYVAVKGDEERVGGVNGDNMRPCYTNPWMLRTVCAAYVGTISSDGGMVRRANGYLGEAMMLFERYMTTSEYNSPTYAGVTLMALGVSQYLPHDSPVRIKGAMMIREIWREIGMTYNASLVNLSGAWDRTYGYDMTLYVTGLGAAITNIIGMKGKFPLPSPLPPSLHLGDAACIPIMCLISPYLESHMSLQARQAFTELRPHSHSAQAISPPFDKSPRRYSFYVGEGYSVGGIEYDECVAGGPSINLECFAPGVVMWDTGREGTGVGWISYVPTSACCSITAHASALVIRYPRSKDFPEVSRCNIMRLHISTFPELQLGLEAFSTPALSEVALPGMSIRLTGNVVDQATPTLSYTGESLHGWRYYVLEYELPPRMFEKDVVPELVVRLEKLGVERRVSLEDTRMPIHPSLLPEIPIVNNPPIPSLGDRFQAGIRVEEVERLISLMRESLVYLEDKTGEFLYTFDDGTVVDTKGWCGWDWTQGVALTVLVHHAQVTSAPTSASRSLEVATNWFETQYNITKGRGAQKNINTMSALYCLVSMLQTGSLSDGDKRWTGWVHEWMDWVTNERSGLPRTKELGFQHVTFEHANDGQLWDDTLFMTCLPLARAAIFLDRPAYLQLAIGQFLLHAQYLCDTHTGLWYHGWQFGDDRGGNGHNFARAKWARGNCWITLAIPMLLEIMDEGKLREDAVRTNLIHVWRRQVNTLLKLQNPDNGMWHTLLDDPQSYYETSATAGFAAGIFMGLRLGLVDSLDKDAYTTSALRALCAVIGQISPTGEVRNVSFGTAMGHNLQFYRDIPITSMPYGQALSMLALVAWLRWKR